ncbi:AI-2E family transporter [Geodermatophilus nigrescens]|uniref:Predicted PurR-regulated permease PerM n=1 Tax=Geodermatophilus nigrescens TaxID=1070870 RepID=A0A1M5IXI7_9ACTN|nr:AI-2E family transporter [Geodermatophilus nigrescens]SHG32981.1 Predicted PurR-regulated permease PerM [Geodermatophilus nigrescens]
MAAQQHLPGPGADRARGGSTRLTPTDEEAVVAAALDAVAVDPDAAVTAPEPAAAGPAEAEPVGPGGLLSGALPRWLVLLVGAAAATIAVAGVREIAWLVAPVMLALVVVVALMPVQRWLLRHGVPRAAAATVLLLLVWGVLLGLGSLLVVAIAQFAVLLPDYAPQFAVLLDNAVERLDEAGLSSTQIQELVDRFDYGQLVGLATDLLTRVTDTATTLVLLLSAMVFLAIESGGFGRRLALVAEDRPHLPIALGLFARGTRSYLLVSTVFGAIVAVGDTIALAILDVPLPVLWGLLSFITNYVPNIGFVLGVIPPALLALLDGGWTEFWVVIVVYSLLNFVVQTLIQPRFVGDSVGLSMTVTFLALLFWGWVLGALGALLAIPLTLLVKALLVDVDPRGHWLDALLREEPRAPRTSRARQRAHARRAALASVRAMHPHWPARRGSAAADTPPDLQEHPADTRAAGNVGPQEDVDPQSGAVPGSTP